MRILTHGLVREGVIVSFTETAFVNGNQRDFQAKVRLTGDSAGKLKTTRIQGIPVNAARNLHESRAVTRILQDPNNDSWILPIDCMAIQ
jgi:hypothetical protein